MNIRIMSIVIASFVFGSIGCTHGTQHGVHYSTHWGYTGSTGPQHWGTLSEKYALCGTGKRQSPINISKTAKRGLPPIDVHYTTIPLNIVNNGHTIGVYTDGGGTITVAGKTYNLHNVHFHEPSEHTINGRPADMVAHLVHVSADKELAVIGVLLDKGGHNAFLQRIWDVMPLHEGEPKIYKDIKINVRDLLPASRKYYSYTGSLTTPPCSEGVKWMVLQQRVSVSADQIDTYRKVYPNSVRPVQPLYGRTVYAKP